MLQIKHIIGIHGVPRSGTSWLAQIFNASPSVNLKFQPLFSYAFKDYLNLSSSYEDMNTFFEELSVSNDDFVNMRDRNLLKGYPQFKKNTHLTHLVFKHIRYHYLLEHILSVYHSIKFIFIIRNPLAVLNSWWSVPREFSPEWSFEEEWLNADLKNRNRKQEYFGYNKWKEAAYLFYDLKTKYPGRVMMVGYSELLSEPVRVSKQLYQYAGIAFCDQVHDFIVESTSKNLEHPNSVYRVKKADTEYQKKIPAHIIDYVHNDLDGTILKKYLND